MTRNEILRKLLTKAVEHGWNMHELGALDSREDILRNIDWYLNNFSENDIIFCIGFAKALWGNEISPITHKKIWKEELQRMVVKKNRLQHLNKFIT
jgi:hypothetical protein